VVLVSGDLLVCDRQDFDLFYLMITKLMPWHWFWLWFKISHRYLKIRYLWDKHILFERNNQLMLWFWFQGIYLFAITRIWCWITKRKESAYPHPSQCRSLKMPWMRFDELKLKFFGWTKLFDQILVLFI
jgi:hypothetical protein